MRYSPSRIIGALRRRQLDWFRSIIYNFLRLMPIQRKMLFESFQGKVVGDNPLPIFEEIRSRNLGFELFFTTSSKTIAPTGAIGAKHGSVAWLAALARSKVLVNNTNFPGFFRKRAGQIYIQTWHGTPLKRLGRDILDVVPTKGYLKMMDREAKSWDFLISPSPYCTELFPRAFNYSGEIIQSGYPRNDVLVNSKARAELRASLGLKETDTAILYAPTWRDYKRTATGNWKSISFLPKDIAAEFKVLFRGHTNTHAAHSKEVVAQAIDVTNYPNVAQLYLAADVLITDYSSSMFDFSVTGKPMIFLAPDIDEYSAKRGFYFDFEASAPGPIVRDPDQLNSLLLRLSQLRLEYTQKYLAWQEKFNSLEDGNASKRVVDRLLTAFHSQFSAP